MERLTLVTPPTSTPVDLATAKRHLRVDYADDDALIQSLLFAATAWAETQARQAFLTQTVRLDLDTFPWGGGYYNRQIRQIGPTTPYWLPSSTFPIDLPRPPVQSVTSVQYYDYANNLDTVDPSLYVFEQGSPARIAPKFGQVWPIAQPRVGAIQITYRVGYGDTASAVPAAVLGLITAPILLRLGDLYYHRGDDGADGSNDTARARDILAAIEHGAYG